MRPALIDAGAGGVATRKGEPFSVAGVPVRDGRIVALDVLADPARLPRLDLAIRHN